MIINIIVPHITIRDSGDGSCETDTAAVLVLDTSEEPEHLRSNVKLIHVYDYNLRDLQYWLSVESTFIACPCNTWRAPGVIEHV
jgi:hypothetical protein